METLRGFEKSVSDESSAEKLCQTLIRPQLECASSAWLSWQQDILQLEKVQCHAARFVHNNY